MVELTVVEEKLRKKDQEEMLDCVARVGHDVRIIQARDGDQRRNRDHGDLLTALQGPFLFDA